ncbi:TadE/TadG family type IV pilus assembly protein [Methylosinus sporium]|uniref:TadE/TadG family type IV pilus assembly protein n=1 Tax=Methylosinus sporium TaxID=428 RepID=UPI00383B536F
MMATLGTCEKRAAFFESRSGATAVEFAFIAPIFVLILVVWIDLGMTLLAQSVLDSATLRAARSVKIGATTTSAAFKTKLCSYLYAVVPCSSIKYSVQSGTSFSALSTTITTDSSNALTNTSFSIGSGGSDVLVQVGFTRTLFAPWLSAFFGKNGYLLILSTVAFQNEPYS